MKRTFTFLLTALFLCVGVVKAQVTSLGELSNDKAYTVSTARGSWYYAPEKTTLSSTNKENIAVDATDAKQQYAFLTVDDKVYLYSVGASKFVVKNGNYTAVVAYPEAYVTFEASGKNEYPVVVALNGANHIGVSNGYDPAVITNWNDKNDEGNQVKIVAVEGTYDFAEALAKINMGLAAERNALLAEVEVANAVYDEIEDKTQAAAVALKAQIDAAVAHANAIDATAETLSAQKAGLGVAQANYFLSAYDLSTQAFNLKNTSTGLYLTIVATEGTNNNAGGLQIKALEEKNSKQMFQFVAADGKYKVKSLENFYLTAFSAWGYKATATESNDAAHEIVYVGDGKYTLKSTLGYVGSNRNATSDGSHMYSNHDGGNPNIYWALEPVAMSDISYTLTDESGNTYTYATKGYEGFAPSLSGVNGCTLSNEAWNGTTYTANIAFPFPVSNAEAVKPVMISSFKNDQNNFLWHAVGTGITAKKGAAADSEDYYWAIYPTLAKGALTFTIKNVGTGKYIYSESSENSHDAGVVVLADEGTDFTFETNNKFKLATGKFLSMNSTTTSGEQNLGTWGDHGGTYNKFVNIVEVTEVTISGYETPLTAAGATVQLTATVAPEDATDKTVTWETSNAEVATVDATGLVTAIANGEATITATAGGQTAECKVTVAIAPSFDTEIVSVIPAEGEVDSLSVVIVQFSNDKVLPTSSVYLIDAIENVYEFVLDANHSDKTQAKYVSVNGALTAAGTYTLDCRQIDHVADMMTGSTINPFEGFYSWTIKAIEDGISNITIDANTVIYDLSGRRVTEMKKGGIYIVNGKKVVNK